MTSQLGSTIEMPSSSSTISSSCAMFFFTLEKMLLSEEELDDGFGRFRDPVSVACVAFFLIID
jgi:hypothetical protein